MKYQYIEFEQLKIINHNSTFLTLISLYNLTSPIINLLMPIFICIGYSMFFWWSSTRRNRVRDHQKKHAITCLQHGRGQSVILSFFVILQVFLFFLTKKTFSISMLPPVCTIKYLILPYNLLHTMLKHLIFHTITHKHYFNYWLIYESWLPNW